MHISVVIPLYNNRDTIGRALKSVLSQSAQPSEIIVVNDGSTDGSDQVVLQAPNPLVKLIRQPNAGVSAARNRGIDTAKGNWIAFLDADDEWQPAFLKTIQELAADHPKCTVLASAYEVQDVRGTRNPIALRKIPFAGRQGVLSNYFEVASCSQPPICSSSVAVAAEAIRSIGGFPVGIRSGEDLLTWARLAVRSEIAYSVVPLSVYHQQPANIGSSHYRDTREDPVGDALLLDMQHCPDDLLRHYRMFISRWFKSKGLILIEIGEPEHARRKLLSAWTHSNERFKLFLYLHLTLFNKKTAQFLYRQLK